MSFFSKKVKIEEKVEKEPVPGSFIVSTDYIYDSESKKVPVYIIRYYDRNGELCSWGKDRFNSHPFNTPEEAKKAYTKHLREEYKIMMHLEIADSAVYSEYEFLQEEAKNLGLTTEITYDRKNKRSQLVFESEEDRNLFQLATSYKEIKNNVFTIKANVQHI